MERPAPVGHPARVQARAQAIVPFDRTAEPANASVYRWRMVAALASVVAVSVLGWSQLRDAVPDAAPALALAVPAAGAVSAGSTVGAAPATVTAAHATVTAAPGMNPPAVMIRDANLDALLAAHKQFGGASALQAPAGFLRNATFDGAVR